MPAGPMGMPAPHTTSASPGARAPQAVAGPLIAIGFLILTLSELAPAWRVVALVATIAPALLWEVRRLQPPPRPGSADLWLLGARAACLLQGVLWGLICRDPGMPAAAPDPQTAWLLLGAAGACGLAARANDRIAGWLFAIPVLSAVGLRLLADGSPLEGRVVAGWALMLLLLAAGSWPLARARGDGTESQHTYEVAINSLADPLAVIDEGEHYRLVNDAWCRFTGLQREQVLGRRSVDVVPATLLSPARRAAAHTCLREQRVVSLVTQAQTADGRLRHLETHYYPFREPAGHQRSIVLVSRDITAHVADREAITAAAECLRATLEATGDAIFASDAADPGQPVRFANRQMLRMWGLPEHLAGSLTPAAIMAAARPLFCDPEVEAAHVQEVIASNRRDESRVALRDGRVLLRRCEPAQLGGQVLRVWSFRDITAEERALHAARDREAEQRALLNAFPGYLGRIDADLNYTYVNARLSWLLGHPAHEIVGRRVGDFSPPHEAPALRAAMRRALAGEAVVLERVAQGPDAGTAVHWTATRIVEPVTGAAEIVVFGIDVSVQKSIESALRQARDDAEQANRAKSQFLAQMSHELRTPLNAIVGFAQVLQHDPAAPLAPHQVRQVHEILVASFHLLELVSEVLDLGRIEAGALTVQSEPVAIASLVAECMALAEPIAAGRSVTLRGPLVAPGAAAAGPLRVLADRTRLKQVLLNILSNAVKYNVDGGDVGVTLVVTAADHLQVQVRDSGPGLDEQAQARLFKPFDRLGAEHGTVEGTGIGLALSARLMQAMGGRIGVKSAPGAGSTFSLELPLVAGEARPSADLAGATRGPPAGSAHAPSGSRPEAAQERLAGDRSNGSPEGLPATADEVVLYVDDNEVNLLLMHAMIERLPGVRLLSTTDPHHGLRLAKTEHPALALVDVHMPQLDGYALREQLARDASTRDIPVIAVSADAMPEDIRRALDSGFADYLTKPLEMATLHDTLRRHLMRRRQ